MYFNRKRNRLKNFDYSQGGCYFVTICTNNRVSYFGEIKNGEMILNKFGKIVNEQWFWLQKQYDYVFLDVQIVMPNHFHGIIAINNPIGDIGIRSSDTKIKSLSSLIGAFKTTSAKLIRNNGLVDFKWQKSFYDRIIRNEKEYYNIQGYIFENPKRWEFDIENKFNKRIEIQYYEKILKK